MKTAKKYKNCKKDGVKQNIDSPPLQTLGDYAYTVINEQYQAMVKLEKKVLADTDPEHLHHMRVGTRRLRTALQVFGHVVELPRLAQAKRIGSLAGILGGLRDLDVQIADLHQNYRLQLNQTEQSLLDQVISALHCERRKAFAAVEDTLTRSRYQQMKAAYIAWLSEPRYTILAQLPLQPVLPDLLSPLLASLLLHPGWLIQATDLSEAADQILHDLRKACKHARYQAEFFAPFYGKSFQKWIEDIKTIQANLGRVHDGQVLLGLLTEHLPKGKKLPNLQAAICQQQLEAMKDWETTRQTYLDPAFRHHLHWIMLEPISSQ